MEKFKKIIDSGINIGLFYIAVTFPLPYKISNIGLVILLVFWLLQKISEKSLPSFRFKNKAAKLVFFSYVAFFIWTLLSLVYTDDVYNGIKNVESKLSLLLLPIILFDIAPSQKRLFHLFRAHIYSMAVCTIVLLCQSIGNYIETGSLLTYHDFTRSLDFHAVFYAYYIFLSILLTVFLYLYRSISKTEKVLLFISLLLSFVGLIISASKNVLVVTTLFLALGFVLRLLKKRIGIKELGFIALFGIIVIGGISQVGLIKDRIAQLTQLNGIENLEKLRKGEKLTETDIRKFNGTSLRIVFWYVSVDKLIRENKVLIGFSPGDRRAVMNEEYFRNGINPWYENYNIHNQFVQSFVELGLIGLVIYLLLHIGLFKVAWETRNYLLMIFLAGFIFFQMTESILERNKGIVFFIYFLILLQQFNLQENENRNLRD